ncbi:class I SAM-dependent methyltransferase [Clostridium tertium]|uniref:class I SAM-dependent methyltransferase n=1 Tax=Clostridium tertium TaxID=1559 RepID=UPI0024B33DB4|nr:methyltransferase domain-containing protein [Clostridium tertium]MDI9216419.1 methyltransferase domain-containing protein [Clostridium tertium]
MKNGSYDASAYTDEKIQKEINRLISGVENDIENMYKCLEEIDFKGNKKLLDLGCGPGGTTKIINKFNPDGEIVAMDREDRFINHAKKLGLKNTTFIKGDCFKLPFDDNEFDCCFSRFVFQHLSNPKDALNELIRVTKPNGIIGVYEWDEGLTCMYPEPKYYKKYISSESTRRRFTSGDIFLGRKMYTLFYNAKIRNINVLQLKSDIFSPGRQVLYDGQLWSDNPSSEHPYVKAGLMTIEEITHYYNELEELIKREDSYVSFGSFFVSGKVNK